MKNRLVVGGAMLLVMSLFLLRFNKPLFAEVKASTKAILVEIEDNPGRNPLELSTTGTRQGVWTVPSAERYVIEAYSATCSVDNTTGLTDVSIFVSGGNLSLSTVPHLVQSNGSMNGHGVNLWTATGVGPFYAEPGSTLVINPNTPDGDTETIETCSFAIMGHIIRKP